MQTIFQQEFIHPRDYYVAKYKYQYRFISFMTRPFGTIDKHKRRQACASVTGTVIRVTSLCGYYLLSAPDGAMTDLRNT
jgi:hypothetical protein